MWEESRNGPAPVRVVSIFCKVIVVIGILTVPQYLICHASPLLRSSSTRSGIECQRLLTKLAVSSALVFGPDHPETSSLGVFLEQAKWRNVLLTNTNPAFLFDKNARPHQMRVVGYDGKCGNRYALSGATRKDPRSLSVDCDDETLWIQPGTPVVCKGLKKATNLNGKIGDVRRHDKSTGRYTVHFADPTLEARSLLGRNLRVLINIPDENELNGDSYIISNSIAQKPMTMDDSNIAVRAIESLSGEDEDKGVDMSGLANKQAR